MPGGLYPYAAGAALLAHVGEATTTGPLLLVLDDAHLADGPSMVGLNFALRRFRYDPVLVLMSVRSSHGDTLPASTMRLAAEAGNRISLPGLDADAIVDLARVLGAGELSHRAAERLGRHAGGSPLHLVTLLTEVPLVELERDDRPVPAPRSFARLVLATLASATEPARRVATAASVLGERAELSHLVTLTGLGSHDVLEALDALSRMRLLLQPPGTTEVEFAHPLIRAAVHEDLAPTARVRLHLRAAGLVGEPPRCGTALRPRSGPIRSWPGTWRTGRRSRRGVATCGARPTSSSPPTGSRLRGPMANADCSGASTCSPSPATSGRLLSTWPPSTCFARTACSSQSRPGSPG